MAKWECSVCGFIYDGDTPPERCPICKVPADKFTKLGGPTSYVSAPAKGVAQQTATPRKGNPVQGVSVIAINVMSENEIARMVEQEVTKEIQKLDAQGKRVVNVSSGSAVKNVIGVKHHVVLLWEYV